jgi:hypothetical protein
LDWQAVGAVADLASAIGVILTLGYLALQIRQNTLVQQAESQRAFFAVGTATSLQLARDENLTRLLLKGLHDFRALSQEERTRFSFLMGNLIGQYAVAHGSYTYGVYGRFGGSGVSSPAVSFLRTPGGAAWWAAFSTNFSAEFRDYVEREVLKPSGNTEAPEPSA